MCVVFVLFFSSRRRHTRCALVTGVQTCALPIYGDNVVDKDLDGSLAPGDRLPSERELAEQMRVSRPVVREAINMLVGQGLLDIRSRREIGRASCRVRVCQYV